MRVLVVGTGGAGAPGADLVAEVLNSKGLHAEWTDQVRHPKLLYVNRFDIVYGIYLQTCIRYLAMAKLLRKKTVLHFVGSDAYWYAREESAKKRMFWHFIVSRADRVFYVSPHLEEMVGRKGVFVPFPIATEQFRRAAQSNAEPDRDILYYCPSGEANERIYRLSWILDYAKSHPDEKITIIGNFLCPANYDSSDYPNILAIPYVERTEMPTLYRRHKTLIRMTTEDGLPTMIHEALLCGLRVIFNGQEIYDVPKEREPEVFAEKVAGQLTELCGQ